MIDVIVERMKKSEPLFLASHTASNNLNASFGHVLND